MGLLSTLKPINIAQIQKGPVPNILGRFLIRMKTSVAAPYACPTHFCGVGWTSGVGLEVEAEVDGGRWERGGFGGPDSNEL
jgi:hypothetical protein